ncbi:MAG: hypothetical protein H6Q90_366 [Deltaproteobacteria bacterium]|nr:hypothetical protein [Deltaproteobacteria bacterium]
MSALLVIALVLPTATSKPPPARTMGKLIDCTSHSVWSEPEGWTPLRSGTDTLVVSPDKQAVLLRTATKTERERVVKTPAADARAIAKRIAGVELTWGDPVVVKKDKYDHTTTISATGVNVEVRVIVRDRGFGKDVVWIEVAEAEDRAAAIATMDAARASELTLTSHACVCGYDCDRRPTP